MDTGRGWTRERDGQRTVSYLCDTGQSASSAIQLAWRSLYRISKASKRLFLAKHFAVSSTELASQLLIRVNSSKMST